MRPRTIQPVNFLAYLSEDLGLAAASVKNHLSAVRTTMRQLGRSRISTDALRDLIRGIESRKTALPRRIASWDVFLVLDYLRGAPFEPLEQASLANLTYKTCFLIALASTHRASEVHAFSGRK